MLTRAQVDHFLTEGFVTVPDLFDAREVDAIRAEVERLKNEGLLRNVRTEGDGKTHTERSQNLQLLPLYPHSTLLRAVPLAPQVVEAVSALLGDPITQWLDQLFLKPARTGAGTNWHTDNAYFKVPDPTAGTAMWIAADQATVSSGTLHVIPRSHLEDYPHERDPDSDHHLRCDPPEERAFACELPAGGAVFFCYGIAHCTRDNTSDQDRTGVAYHFINTERFSRDLLPAGRHPYPVLTGPEATGGEAEYGVRIDGTWRDEVRKVLAERQSTVDIRHPPLPLP